MNTELQRQERLRRIKIALEQESFACLVCANNLNVLALSGYWPVIGASIAVATAEPRITLIVPEDEEELAQASWADDVHTYRASAPDAVREPLAVLMRSGGFDGQRIACEMRPSLVPTSYAAVRVTGQKLSEFVQAVVTDAHPRPGDHLLEGLRLYATDWETEKVRMACRIAGQAYVEGARELAAGVASGTSEMEAVLPFHAALIATCASHKDVCRADGFFYCMSGANAAQAYAAYQRSRHKPLRAGELILVHCNSYIDGYWTDLTRTYFAGEPEPEMRRIYQAIFNARDAALEAIRPGTLAADVDRAARSALEKSGYGAAFKHATGHGVGFSAIDHNERPRIAPQSDEVLEPGMIFNVEPGIYLDGVGGLRQCEMVAVTESGYELLSPFHGSVEELLL